MFVGAPGKNFPLTRRDRARADPQAKSTQIETALRRSGLPATSQHSSEGPIAHARAVRRHRRKAVRGAPEGFAVFHVDEGVRAPGQILVA